MPSEQVMRKNISVDELVEGLRRRNRRLLAKALSLIESTNPADIDKSQSLLAKLTGLRGASWRIGVSGIPGVGKSSFIEVFGRYAIDQGRRVAVLTVDPSSPRSGGSVLGDRTRMQGLARNEAAFIRPSPSSGNLGGVARSTRAAMLLCEAAGYDLIIVETVGVGQSEITVASMVDMFLALMLPNAGDELQGMKRGIMEVVDTIVINKADGDQVRAANKARSQLSNTLHLFAARSEGWTPRVLTCSALEQRGIEPIWQSCCEFFSAAGREQIIDRARRSQALDWMRQDVSAELQRLIEDLPPLRAILPALEDQVRAGTMDPLVASGRVLARIRKLLHSAASSPRAADKDESDPTDTGQAVSNMTFGKSAE